MKFISLSLFLTILCAGAFGADSRDSLLTALNKAIAASPTYDAQKDKAIQALRVALEDSGASSLSAKYSIYLQLYNEYKSYKYDSAYAYARKLESVAYEMKDPSRIVYARVKLGFTLVSSGLFKETFDSLNTLHTSGFPDSIRAEYYSLMGRFYYDLGDFDNDSYYTAEYNKKGSLYIDSALSLYPTQSFQYSYFEGLQNLKGGKIDQSAHFFLEVIGRNDLSPHQLAIVASTLSDIYIRKGQTDTAIDLLIRAAIADIESSTKETSAMLNLAELLFKKGDVRNASEYIERAMTEAVFYGARQRKIQAGAILPIIEDEKINTMEGQRKILIEYASVVTFLLLVLVALSVIIFRQMRKLRLAQQTISDAHAHTQEINHQLMEANKIKEEYIGYFFNVNSDYFAKVEKFKKAIEQKLGERKFDDIRFLAGNINLKKEKEDLLQHFDKVFLKLFPHFVADYNALFKPEDQVHLKDEELLNTDLRIFALIRMGISDNEKIAKILEYSVNTIYTYKTRIKNKSLVHNDEFEEKIMQIRTM
jgi:tetratricopeptide (TPR) repeat protein